MISSQSSRLLYSSLISSTASSPQFTFPSSSSHNGHSNVFPQSSQRSTPHSSSSPGPRGSGLPSISCRTSRNRGHPCSQPGCAPVHSKSMIPVTFYVAGSTRTSERDKSWWISANGCGWARGGDGRSIAQGSQGSPKIFKISGNPQLRPHRSRRVSEPLEIVETLYPRLLHLRAQSYTPHRRSKVRDSPGSGVSFRQQT